MGWTNEQALETFGMTEEELNEMVETAKEDWFMKPSSLVISIASDVQEEIERGMNETARKNLNKLKYIIHHYLSEKN